jgi:hypothetical protein
METNTLTEKVSLDSSSSPLLSVNIIPLRNVLSGIYLRGEIPATGRKN